MSDDKRDKKFSEDIITDDNQNLNSESKKSLSPKNENTA